MRLRVWSMTAAVLVALGCLVVGVVFIARNPDPTHELRSRPPGATDAHSARVIDSVSSTINTDSLYRAYHSMLAAAHPEGLLPLVSCIEAKLMWQHGMYPADQAMRRMRDTLWKGVEQQAQAMDARFPVSGYAESNDALCGPFGRRGQLVADGVPLDPSPNESGQVHR